jgi:hypothetical protein
MDRGRFRFQLVAKDQVEYPRGDEWFVFDIAEIDRTVATADVIEIEKQLEFTLDQIVGGLYEGSTHGKLMAFWLARRFAGVKEELDFFTPQVRAAEVQYLKDDDAVPPEESASADESPTP